MIALSIAVCASAAFGLCLVRLFTGPTLYDRLLSANATMVKASLVIAALAVAAGEAAWVDAALAASLIGLVLNVAALKFFRAKSFQPPLAQLGEGS